MGIAFSPSDQYFLDWKQRTRQWLQNANGCEISFRFEIVALNSNSSIFSVLNLYLFRLSGIVGVEIKDMVVPRMIESGSQSHVILDCDYDLLDNNEGYQVDVKWFFRDDPQPFFQWLPGRPPQAIGEIFQDRIDLTYEVEGSDQFRKHRAIKILNPTTELTGIYKCKVSSFVDEDFMQKPMIVYGEYATSNSKSADSIRECLLSVDF